MPALSRVALCALLAASALSLPARAHAGPGGASQGAWSLEVTDEWGGRLPTFEHRGRTFVLGEAGQRYVLRVRNGSGRRVEVVATVDGLDVIDGRKGSLDRRGYIVEPYGEVAIDGFRLDTSSVAAFRFGSVARSYAASKGDARDVGVIGVAIFPERAPAYRPPYRPRPYPYPEGFRGGAGERSEAPPSDAPAAAESQAPSKSASPSAQRDFDRQRPGLGTEFGERHGSEVHEVAFERASGRPAAVLTLRYDDRRGLLAAGVDLDRWGWEREDEAWRRAQANPFRADGPFSEPPPGWRPY
jgi:hypothetical protein